MQIMNVQDFERSLSTLKGKTVAVSPSGQYTGPESSSARILFSDGSTLRADYWRLITRGKAGISSFDHNQQYGLPAPIDVFNDLRRELEHKPLAEARWDRRTGDLLLVFEGELELQILNFTGYEVWELCFRDKISMYSNYAK